ncbi:hypothetical protein GAO09_04830 [Rhizobiales bacterium RZME27]|uniref:Uncharacterized protein n=1 Tax=Endobacterium cereale TaxID=2663029 RepID=A0A6A8A3N2_9HYPH|nr:hypothetical protein [Endobacterium cereale]MEB2846516.1 hypothetical protein [Endobacterium cereale]MQY45389.1 hypothetical protein [Endobacterium cereale]
MGILETVLVGAGIGVVAIWIWANIRRFLSTTGWGTSRLDREFRNVFALMPEARRRDLVETIMNRRRCSRAAAMRFAMDDRARDERRWD